MITAIFDPDSVMLALKIGFFCGLVGIYLLRMFFIRCKWFYVAAVVFAAIQWGAAKSIFSCIVTMCEALIMGDQTALIICSGIVGAILACLLPCYKVSTFFIFGRREHGGQQLPANTAQQAAQVQQAAATPAPVRNRRGWSW